ncbi:MAG: hypothetical protein J6O90_02315 [Candidatus Methanomethylophilaceae archaeon]|nr:hypothetical protein [Candidatus Methanomethylophilaceae archaeon]
MARLIGRGAEIRELNRAFADPETKTVAVWGRRRVGKTALVREFCRDKTHIILTAVEGSFEGSLRSFDRSLDAFTGTEGNGSKSLGDVLERIMSIFAGGERLVIVFDDYPLLSVADKASDASLRKFIDIGLKGMKALLIVCGSSGKAMRNILENKSSPLCGSFQSKLAVEPLRYRACQAFHPYLSEQNLLRIYSIAGGIPYYHQMMWGNDIEECIKNSLVGPGAPLLEEVRRMAAVDMQPADTNMRILRAISEGHATGREIADITGQTTTACYQNLSNLEMLGIVSQINPMCGANKKEKIYRISNGLVRVYNDIIIPNMTAVTDPDRDVGYKAMLHPLIDFYGSAFETMCRQYVADNYRCTEMGSWWEKRLEKDPIIDIVAHCRDGGNEFHLVCECRFGNEETGMRELDRLVEASDRMEGCYNRRYCLFSRAGFTNDLRAYAENNDIDLMDLRRMYSMG